MLYFIVNPTSSSGRGQKVWEEAEKYLQKEDIPYECYILGNSGEGALTARMLEAKKPLTLIIVGGDGTIGEVLSGFTSFDGITLGYLPTGSGNDFARGMNLPKDPEKALQTILTSRRRRRIHIGIVQSGKKEQLFAVSSGLGFDAAVCFSADHDPAKALLNRLHLGKLVYTLNALKLLLTIDPFPLRIYLDRQNLLSFDKVYFAAAMNTPFEGGGFMFAPKATPCDTTLDIVVAEGLPRWKIILAMPLALLGLHTHVKGVHLYTCSEARFLAQSQQCVHADGEHAGFFSDVTFRLRKDPLKVIVQEKS